MLRGFLIMRTTFLYFPGMFENPALAVKTSCKRIKHQLKIQNQKYYEILTIYECVEK